MCRVTRLHTWRNHISTQELGQLMGIDSIDTYIYRRQLRWLGHVARMDFDRLPRRMCCRRGYPRLGRGGRRR